MLKHYLFPSQFMYRDSCYFADIYSSVVRSFSDPEQIAAVDRVHQFPFVAPVIDEKSEEELARAAEKRKENGRRLVEMQQKQRVEKVRQTFPQSSMAPVCRLPHPRNS